MEKQYRHASSKTEQQAFFLGMAQSAVDARLAQLSEQHFGPRLWEKDASLWKQDPDHQAIIRKRLGWLSVADSMHVETTTIDAFVDQVRGDGLTHAVLLGMGGSSLAPEVLSETFGTREGYLPLQVLDNTSPDAVRAIERSIDLEQTLFLVSSKSGTTTETLGFYRYFRDKLKALGGEDAGRHFVAITDPGSLLEDLGREEKFRRVFLNPADIGGRYSALSYFGLVPAALLGIDLRRLLQAAQDLAEACGPSVAPAANPALFLGAALGELARNGCDKVTLVPSPQLRTFGTWVEQLLAESSGKEGSGLIPVEDEPLGQPECYDPDRVFVALSTAADEDAFPQAALDALQHAGHPVLRWTLPNVYHVGAEFLRWELATATACAILGVDAFDEPNVTESKDTTKDLLGRYQQSGRLAEEDLLARAGGLRLHGDKDTYGAGTGVTDCLRVLLESVRKGDYLALMAYMPRNPAVQRRLTGLRTLLRDRLRKATTLGYGPRFLHSTGQLHKGGPNNGVFLQITVDPELDLAIPGEPYSFGTLHRAQALGDLQVLQRHDRRVLRVHLGGDTEGGLAELESYIQDALTGIQMSKI